MKKNIAILFLAVIFSLTVVAGCGAPISQEAFPSEFEELIPISMINRVTANYEPNNNPVLEEFGRRVGAKITLEAPPLADYNARLNVIMASGDIPDIVYNWTPTNAFMRWAFDGMFLPLDGYIDQMPTVRMALDDTELYGQYYINDQIVGLPRLQPKNDVQIILYRGDWLEKAGLGIPETVEEYREAMRAFTDPAITGSSNTYGMSAPTIGAHAFQFFDAFEILRDTFPNRKGEYHTEVAQEGYLDLLTFFRDMYAEGTLDQEYYLNTGYDDITKFDNGRAGVAYHNQGISHYISKITTNPNNVFKLNNPEAEVVWGTALRSPNMSKPYIHAVPPVWGVWCVNADIDVNYKMDTIIRIFEFGYSNEGIILTTIGWPGFTYDAKLSFPNRGIYVRDTSTPEGAKMQENAKYVGGYMQFNARLMDRGPVSRSSWEDDARKTIETEDIARAKYTVLDILPQYDSWAPGTAALRTANTEVTTKMEELRTQYICGIIDSAAWTDFVEKEWIPAWEEYMNIIRKLEPNKDLAAGFWNN